MPNTSATATAPSAQTAVGGARDADAVEALRSSESMGIDVDGVSKAFGSTPVLNDVALHVRPGALVALLGPSGCGKTTLLRLMAGLDAPDGGAIRVAGRVLVGPSTNLPPEKRRVGLVFQDWALFPHMSVADNVGYGLGRSRERSDRIDQALALVGLSGLGDRMPGTLSGGQQQRVAIARAVAPQPAVLLLDEPFSNLDTSLRAQVRSEIHELLVSLGITTVIVTHDQEEAFVLGDQVAVMHDGRIVQQATPAELYQRPSSPWVARFVGDANLVAGTGRGGLAETPIGPVPLEAVAEGPLDVLVRPEECRVAPGGDARIELVEFYGHDTVYVVGLADGSRLRVREGAAPTVSRGDVVEVRYIGGPTIAYAAGSPAMGGATPQGAPLVELR